MKTPDVDRCTKALVQAAVNVLAAFRGGWNPTEEQLNRLDGALIPFTTDKVCGCPMLDDCNCFAEQEG